MTRLSPDQLDRMIDAPDGFKRLRELVLSLAVRGKLIPQDPKDEPAEKLFERIQTARKCLIANKTTKAIEGLLPIADDEKKFKPPDGWICVRLGELLSKIGAGSTPRGGKDVYVDEGPMFLRSQNVWNEGLRVSQVAKIPRKIHESMANTAVQSADILFNITGASIGRCAVVPAEFSEANVSQHVTIVRLVEPELRGFLHKALISDLVQTTVMDAQVGISREGLSVSRLSKFVIALPPPCRTKAYRRQGRGSHGGN